METQEKGKYMIPNEAEEGQEVSANSYKKVLEVLNSNERDNNKLRLQKPPLRFKFDQDEKRSLRRLPKAFDLNRTVQQLEFVNFEVDNPLLADAMRAAVRKDMVNLIQYTACGKMNEEKLMDTMCQGFQERSTEFQLILLGCSSEYAKPILEASYPKCFSLSIQGMRCSEFEHSLKKFFTRETLCYLQLYQNTGLRESVFLELARCVAMLPRLTKLDLGRTMVPTSPLKRLHGSLEKILEPGRSKVFKKLDLGEMDLSGKLRFAYFRLLRSDVVQKFFLWVKKDVSTAIVKNTCANIANTKRLEALRFQRNFSSGTEFKNFCLQNNDFELSSPFGVNPTEE